MDLEYLLKLQELREMLGPEVERLVSLVSDGSIFSLTLLVPAVIYWAYHKENGLKVFWIYGLGQLFMSLVKITACIYRPWMREPGLKVSAFAKETATGYSFPSGHSTAATSLWGSIGWLCRKDHKKLAAGLWLLVAVVLFTRNYLGCHTPQDVAVGLAVGICSMVLVLQVSPHLEDKENTALDLMLLGLGLLLLVGGFFYTALKSYPMDYVAGVLVADPADMRLDTYKMLGLFGGILLGWFCERRFIGFETEGCTRKERKVRCLVGLLLVAFVYFGLGKGLEFVMAKILAKTLKYFLSLFCILFVVPLTFREINRKYGR